MRLTATRSAHSARTGPAVLCLLLALCGVPTAARAQETDRAFEAAAAELRAAAGNPETSLLQEVAAFRTREALELLFEVYPQLGRTALREALAAALTRFAATDQADRARRFLFRIATDAEYPEDTAAAAEALTAFGAAGRTALREAAGGARTFHAEYAALLHLAGLAHPGDRELHEDIAFGRRRQRLVAAGFPEGNERWEVRYSELRVAAVRACFQHSEAGLELEPLLGDPDPEVHAVALVELGARASPEALRYTEFVLDAQHPAVLQRAAVEVCRRRGTAESLEQLLRARRRVSPGLCRMVERAIVTMDREMVKSRLLQELQQSGGDGATRHSIELLHYFPDPDVTRALLGGLEHADPAVRVSCMRALGERGAREAVPALTLAYKQRDPEIRAAALLALARLLPEDPSWRDTVLRAARRRQIPLRKAAIEAMAFLPGPEVHGALVDLAQGRDWHVRLWAVQSLAARRERETVPVLIARQGRERQRLQEEIARHLEALTGESHGVDTQAWREWWEQRGEAFELPAELAPRADPMSVGLRQESGRASRSFYGIPVTSDHFVLVIDVSGSMGKASRGRSDLSRLDVAKREIIQLLRNLPAAARVNLVFFHSRAERWKSQLVALSPAMLRAAVEYAESQAAEGGTNLYAALQLAYRDPAVDTIYLLSDGQPTAGEFREVDELREAVRRLDPSGEVVLHGVSIGERSRLLELLALDTGGSSLIR